MADRLTASERSALMSRIRGANTGTELRVFRELRRRRVYFAKHASALPGRPDVVFRSVRLAVFIDGDFWHGRRFANWRGKISKFWVDKISRNIRRDRANDRQLRRAGWKVIHLWSKVVDRAPEKAVDRVLRARARLLHKRAGPDRKAP